MPPKVTEQDLAFDQVVSTSCKFFLNNNYESAMGCLQTYINDQSISIKHYNKAVPLYNFFLVLTRFTIENQRIIEKYFKIFSEEKGFKGLEKHHLEFNMSLESLDCSIFTEEFKTKVGAFFTQKVEIIKDDLRFLNLTRSKKLKHNLTETVFIMVDILGLQKNKIMRGKLDPRLSRMTPIIPRSTETKLENTAHQVGNVMQEFKCAKPPEPCLLPEPPLLPTNVSHFKRDDFLDNIKQCFFQQESAFSEFSSPFNVVIMRKGYLKIIEKMLEFKFFEKEFGFCIAPILASLNTLKHIPRSRFEVANFMTFFYSHYGMQLLTGQLQPVISPALQQLFATRIKYLIGLPFSELEFKARIKAFVTKGIKIKSVNDLVPLDLMLHEICGAYNTALLGYFPSPQPTIAYMLPQSQAPMQPGPIFYYTIPPNPVMTGLNQMGFWANSQPNRGPGPWMSPNPW